MTDQHSLVSILSENNCRVKGNIKDLDLSNFSHFSNVKESSIIWLGKKFIEKNGPVLVDSQVNCLVTDHEELSNSIKAKVYILTDNPQYVYTLLYNTSIKQKEGFIHPSSVIHPEAVIHPSV